MNVPCGRCLFFEGGWLPLGGEPAAAGGQQGLFQACCPAAACAQASRQQCFFFKGAGGAHLAPPLPLWATPLGAPSSFGSPRPSCARRAVASPATCPPARRGGAGLGRLPALSVARAFRAYATKTVAGRRRGAGGRRTRDFDGWGGMCGRWRAGWSARRRRGEGQEVGRGHQDNDGGL